MISAVILTKNEEENIVDCIESVLWCDEIVVIDDFSIDRTVELAKRSKAKVFQRTLDNDFAAQRNFGLEQTKGDWVFFLDADERVNNTLQKEILYKTTKDGVIQGFYCKRRDFIWGKELLHGEIAHVRLLRLAKKNAGKWKGNVHEVWKVKGKKKTFDNALLHYPHKTLNLFLREINRYSKLRAEELYRQGKSIAAWQILLYPKVKFIQNYFFRLGFLDGIPGLLVALLMSFHSFLVRSKLWLLTRRSE